MPSARQPSRVDKQLVSGHFTKDTVLALHELLAINSRRKGDRITVQAAIARGLELYFEEYGKKPPAELTEVAARPRAPRAKRRHDPKPE